MVLMLMILARQHRRDRRQVNAIHRFCRQQQKPTYENSTPFQIDLFHSGYAVHGCGTHAGDCGAKISKSPFLDAVTQLRSRCMPGQIAERSEKSNLKPRIHEWCEWRVSLHRGPAQLLRHTNETNPNSARQSWPWLLPSIHELRS